MSKGRQHKIQQNPIEIMYIVGKGNLFLSAQGCRD
jgi:hypothetical protein